MKRFVNINMCGTLIDKGCWSNVNAFQKAFKYFGIDVHEKTIRKTSHFGQWNQVLFIMTRTGSKQQWLESNGRHMCEGDNIDIVHKLNCLFPQYIDECGKTIRGAKQLTSKLRDNGYYITCTHDLLPSQAWLFSDLMDEQGVHVDELISNQYLTQVKNYNNDYLITVADSFRDVYNGLVVHSNKIIGVSNGSGTFSKDGKLRCEESTQSYIDLCQADSIVYNLDDIQVDRKNGFI